MQSQTIQFDELVHPVAVAFDADSATVSVFVNGNLARLFVGTLEAADGPVMIEPEPIVDEP